MSKIIGIIPARYGSKRFPGKPLADIDGKSLLQRTYENAVRCKIIDELYVATDDIRIAHHAEKFGAKAIMTSEMCPTGTERLVEALKSLKITDDDPIIVNVQGDIPLLEPAVFKAVVKLLQNHPLEVIATAVCPIESEAEADDPHIVKCVLDKTGHAMYFSRSKIPYSPIEGCPRYHHLGIYAYRYEFIRHYAKLEPTPLQRAEDLEQLKILEHGFRIKAALVESGSFGIDRPEDIEKMKQVLWQ
jgi:3-deoxy-manno-octulosonate cytidylyltransferase (CMP-KDO synthetase)